MQQIEQLDQKFHIGSVLVDKLQDYFQNFNSESEIEHN